MKIFKTVPFFKEETAVALGFFDGVHIAHQRVISLTVESDLLPVVLTFDVDRKIPAGKGNLLLLKMLILTRLFYYWVIMTSIMYVV